MKCNDILLEKKIHIQTFHHAFVNLESSNSLISNQIISSKFLPDVFYEVGLNHCSQIRGPQAICDPPNEFVRPARISKAKKL